MKVEVTHDVVRNRVELRLDAGPNNVGCINYYESDGHDVNYLHARLWEVKTLLETLGVAWDPNNV